MTESAQTPAASAHKGLSIRWWNRVTTVLAALMAFLLTPLGKFGEAIAGIGTLLHWVQAWPAWAYALLMGLLILLVLLGFALEILDWRERRQMRWLAQERAMPRPGYFRIGPYEDRPEDRAAFDRGDRMHAERIWWASICIGTERERRSPEARG